MYCPALKRVHVFQPDGFGGASYLLFQIARKLYKRFRALGAIIFRIYGYALEVVVKIFRQHVQHILKRVKHVAAPAYYVAGVDSRKLNQNFILRLRRLHGVVEAHKLQHLFGIIARQIGLGGLFAYENFAMTQKIRLLQNFPLRLLLRQTEFFQPFFDSRFNGLCADFDFFVVHRFYFLL